MTYVIQSERKSQKGKGNKNATSNYNIVILVYMRDSEHRVRVVRGVIDSSLR